MSDVSQIFLGTAKLGEPTYGLFSASKRELEPMSFLQSATELGFTHFDTSPRYKEAEQILGSYFKKSGLKPFVASKIDHLFPQNPASGKLMEQSVKNSLKKLNLPALDVCYLHQNDVAILSDRDIQNGLLQLKDRGLIRLAGASVYSLDEAQYALESGIFEVIQVPISVFDLGFYDLVKRYSKKIIFVARSLLLQGILVHRGQIGERIKQSALVSDYLNKLDRIAAKINLSTLEMSLAFVFSLPQIRYFVIGSTSAENLRKDIDCLKIKLPKETAKEITALARLPKEWTNPRNWQ